MTEALLLTRRMLLRDMGKAGLVIAVMGAAACTTDGGSGSTTRGSDGTTTTRRVTTTTGATVTTEVSTTGATSASGHRWARADLGFVSAYILYRAGEAAVVDSGVAGSEGVIEAGLAGAGLGWDAVGHVVITHKHNDHQGSLEGVLAAAPDADWYAGSGDMGSVLASRPGTAVGDGDSVFGLDIIETPGHTPGHICVLDPVGGILVTGDATGGDGSGGLTGANPQFTEDLAQATESIRKLAGFDYEVVLVGHGEPVDSDGSEAMSALAATLG
jgi:glyoxylase-like metal-dependent hydrolase (beta-lactamase superfamily II)